MSVRRAAEQVIMDAEERFEGFGNLMPFKVHDILLVSSLYDSFILREDGRLNELLIDESLELNLRQIPGITHVSSCLLYTSSRCFSFFWFRCGTNTACRPFCRCSPIWPWSRWSSM